MSIKTEKLYYENAYISDFYASVISTSKVDDGFDVVLDKTAFFPEEGGQSADEGYIAESRVIRVYEKDGVVHHITDTEPTLGEHWCNIDFDSRFQKMQCHTAEHILCGIIHSLYGFENVGFHLGVDEVTFDIDGVLDRSQLDKIEEMANDVVSSNIQVKAFFPPEKKLPYIKYRSKLDITEEVRLVEIDGVDICACCAPHVANTGEIGLIKILDFMKHRGGTRIWMVAGKRALLDYRARYDNIKRISAMLCTPQLETADTLESYIKDSEAAKNSLKAARLRIAELEAGRVEKTPGNAVFLLSDFTIPELIAFSNIAGKMIGGIMVALSGADGDYKYVISSGAVDLRERAKEINSALNGRGGGRPEMIQGSFCATLEQIKDYFK